MCLHNIIFVILTSDFEFSFLVFETNDITCSKAGSYCNQQHRRCQSKKREILKGRHELLVTTCNKCTPVYEYHEHIYLHAKND